MYAYCLVCFVGVIGVANCVFGSRCILSVLKCVTDTLRTLKQYISKRYRSLRRGVPHIQILQENSVNSFLILLRSVRKAVLWFRAISDSWEQYQLRVISDSWKQYQTIESNVRQLRAISVSWEQYQSDKSNIGQLRAISDNCEQYQTAESNVRHLAMWIDVASF